MIDISQTCSDASGALWGIFDLSIAPPLLYYAYIPILVVSVVLGATVLIKERNSLRSKIFFWLTVVFALLLLNEIVQWVAAPVSFVYFSWQLVPLFRILVAILTVAFVFVFIYNKGLGFLQKAILGTWLALTLLLLSTDTNIAYFDLSSCEGVPSWLWDMAHVFEIAAMLWVLGMTIHSRVSTKIQSLARRVDLWVGIGATLFLAIFFATSIWGDITQVYDVALMGPFGMLIFVALITVVIVRYRAFNIKVAVPVVLVFTLWLLIFSLLFVHTVEMIQIIVAGTLALVVIFGVALIHSVRREIAVREKNEELVKDLARVNVRLRELDRQKSEFVSIASHQLRSPLTAIRGYASLILEGSFGKLPVKAQEAIERIHESSGFMALSIEDFLNVSRIEQGRMKYEFADTNIREMASKIADELRGTALKKGLVLLFRSQCEGTTVANIDPGKMRQIIYNLVDNATKYTQKGSITIFVSDDLKARKIRIAISDTGVGMSQETLDKIFDKFVRAKNANAVNVTGTGLGLYVAKQMIESMQGRIIPESEGEGKGSTFTIEVPMA